MGGEQEMFTAQTISGKVISILNVSHKTIKMLQKEEKFFCPSCKGEVILKMGVKKQPHFAHKRTCLIKPEGESEIHLLGKKKLFEWLMRHGYEPRLESFLSILRQQPDVLFLWNEKRVAIEFQCSIIDVKEIERRTLNYLNHSYWPLWIVYQKHVITRHDKILHLNEFLTRFINQAPGGFPFLLSFDPESERLFSYNNIIPFSKNRAYTSIVEFSLHDSLEKIVLNFTRNHHFYHHWFFLQKKSIERLSILPNGRKNPFLQYLYQNRIHATQLPPEIGIPVPNMFLIVNSPFEWQFYIWFYFLYKRKINTVFSIQQIDSFIEDKLKYMILFRKLPLFTKEDQFQPIHAYLQFLTDVGFFERVGDKLRIRKIPELIKNPNVNREVYCSDFYRRFKAIILRPFLLTD
jgi:competence protein CoiA